MNLVVFERADKPIYEQIYAQISAQIMSGELGADVCLPSIRVLSGELRISVITVKKAYEMLEEDGYIYTLAGKGCFVKNHGDALDSKRREKAQEKLSEAVEHCRTLGLNSDQTAEIFNQINNKK